MQQSVFALSALSVLLSGVRASPLPQELSGDVEPFPVCNGVDEFGQPQVIDDGLLNGRQNGVDEFGQPQVIDDGTFLDRRQQTGLVEDLLAADLNTANGRPFEILHSDDGTFTVRFPNDRIPAGGETITINNRVISIPGPVAQAKKRDEPATIIFNGDSLLDVTLPESLISFGQFDKNGKPIAIADDARPDGAPAKRQTVVFDQPPLSVDINGPAIQINTNTEPSVTFNPDNIDVTISLPNTSRVKRQGNNNGDIGGSGTTIVFNDETIDLNFNAPFININ